MTEEWANQDRSKLRAALTEVADLHREGKLYGRDIEKIEERYGVDFGPHRERIRSYARVGFREAFARDIPHKIPAFFVGAIIAVDALVELSKAARATPP